MPHAKNKDVSGSRMKPEEQPAAKDAAPVAKRRPVKTLRVEDCSVSIWARDFVVQGQPRTFYSVTLERSYKDRDGQWRYTKSFELESLGKLVTLCQQASEFIHGLQQDAERSAA